MLTLTDFRRRYLRLARRYPRLARGGLNVREMRELAVRIARKMGMEVDIQCRPWPWPATISRVGRHLFITVDDRQNPGKQVSSLAHELGHLAMAHFALEPFFADGGGYGGGCGDEEWEADVFALLVLDRIVSPLEHLGPEQLELL